MKDKQITLIPVGGLANRMRAIESAIALSKNNEQPLKIIWFKDWGMGCTYHELFEYMEYSLNTVIVPISMTLSAHLTYLLVLN